MIMREAHVDSPMIPGIHLPLFRTPEARTSSHPT
jgi:hypothetical protein